MSSIPPSAFRRATSLLLLTPREERAAERRHFCSKTPLSDSLPARRSQGEREKVRSPQLPHVEGSWFPAGIFTEIVCKIIPMMPRNSRRNLGVPCFLTLLVQTARRLAVSPHRFGSRNRRRKICGQREEPARSPALAALASAAEDRELRWNGACFCFLKHRLNR
jgi:hypothetical protein